LAGSAPLHILANYNLPLNRALYAFHKMEFYKLIEQKIKAAVKKHSTKLFIFGMIGVSLLDILMKYLFNSGVSSLFIFIASFSLAIYVFQKVLIEVLSDEAPDK